VFRSGTLGTVYAKSAPFLNWQHLGHRKPGMYGCKTLSHAPSPCWSSCWPRTSSASTCSPCGGHRLPGPWMSMDAKRKPRTLFPGFLS